MTKKNPAAVALGRRGGKKRAANMTENERAEAARIASEAAKAWREANPDERSEIARKAAQARWKGHKKKTPR